MYCAYVNDIYVDDVATTKGWEDFGKWAADLDAETHLEVVHLAEHGWSQNIEDLKRQMALAYIDVPPPASAKQVAVAVLKAIGSNSKAYMLVVSDGFTDEDDGSQEE